MYFCKHAFFIFANVEWDGVGVMVVDQIEFERRMLQPSNGAQTNAFEYCMGVDEVGRGCIAGPVVAASVIIPEKVLFSTEPPEWFLALDDSKKITPKKRLVLCQSILQQCLVSLAFASVAEIDAYNILRASLAAMRRSIDCLIATNKSSSWAVLVDGTFDPFDKRFFYPEPPAPKAVSELYRDDGFVSFLDSSFAVEVLNVRSLQVQCFGFDNFLRPTTTDHKNRVEGTTVAPAHVQTIVKGDSHSRSIAAASIVAKVVRDAWMAHVAGHFPNYYFEVHKGYSTQKHLKQLQDFGPCRLHRKTFEPVATMVKDLQL